MTTMKRQLPVLAVMLCILAAVVSVTAGAEEGIYDDNLYYTKYYVEDIDGDLAIAITGYDGNKTEIEIPSEIEGLPVTRIEAYAFYNCSDLTQVEIPNSIKYIGPGAFSECSNLTNISLPDSPIYIGRSAFEYNVCDNGYIGNHLIYQYTGVYYAIREGTKSIADGAFDNWAAGTSLKHLFIPDSVLCIADRALEYCSNLTDIYYQGTEEEWYNVSVGESNFALYNANIHYNCTNSDKIIIEEGECGEYGNVIWTLDTEGTLTISGDGKIKSYAFSKYNFNHTNLIKNVVIESGITNIGYNAYQDCSNLETITISDTVTQIDSLTEAGYDSDKLLPSFRAINVDKDNPEYSSVDGVLFNKEQTILIKYPKGKTDENYNAANSLEMIGAEAFKDNSHIKEILFPSGCPLTVIGNAAFENCSQLANIKIPNGVSDIGHGAFRRCVSLAEIDVPYGVTRLSDLFDGCTLLSAVTIPDTVVEVLGDTFRDCASLVEINIPKNVETFSVPYGCSSLKAINVDTENETFCSENGVLFNKTKTILLRFPEALVCDIYEIPDTVTKISSKAFRDCSKVKIIKMANSVSEIASAAFWGCDAQSITISENVAVIDTTTFEECHSLTDITLPDNLTEIRNAAFRDCSALKSVYIPSTVTFIAYDAFNCCGSLEGIEVDSSNENYTSIDGVLFNKDCSKLIQYTCGSSNTLYKIPDCVVDVDCYTFANSQHLTDVILSRNMKTIREDTFRECPALTNVILPKGIEKIEASAFFDCKALKSIYYEGSENEWDTVDLWYSYDEAGRDLYVIKAEKIFNTVLPSPEKCFRTEHRENSIAVINTSEIPQRADVIIANYENNVLKELSITPTQFYGGETKEYIIDNTMEVKVFVWDNLLRMMPLEIG